MQQFKENMSKHFQKAKSNFLEGKDEDREINYHRRRQEKGKAKLQSSIVKITAKLTVLKGNRVIHANRDVDFKIQQLQTKLDMLLKEEAELAQNQFSAQDNLEQQQQLIQQQKQQPSSSQQEQLQQFKQSFPIKQSLNQIVHFSKWGLLGIENQEIKPPRKRERDPEKLRLKYLDKIDKSLNEMKVILKKIFQSNLKAMELIPKNKEVMARNLTYLIKCQKKINKLENKYEDQELAPLFETYRMKIQKVCFQINHFQNQGIEDQQSQLRQTRNSQIQMQQSQEKLKAEKKEEQEILVKFPDEEKKENKENKGKQEQSKEERKEAKIDESKLCSICLDRPKLYAAIPCGHYIYCEVCKELALKEKKCSICRDNVVTMVKIFQ